MSKTSPQRLFFNIQIDRLVIGFSALVACLCALVFDEARGRVFHRHLLDAARADAGIESATLAAYTPTGRLDTASRRVAIEGYAAATAQAREKEWETT